MDRLRCGSVWVLALAMPACVVTAIGTGPTTTSSAQVSAYVESEPPPPQPEVVEPKPGYIFVAGHWAWVNAQWTWIAGHWERERAGYAWNAGRWERQGTGWIWIEGSWVVTATAATAPQPPPTVAPPPSSPNAVSMMALGEGSTCSLSVAGQIRCWGYNHYGALGTGSREMRFVDGYVTGVDGDVRSIAAGGYQQCALTAKGDVWCWGSNLEGQVGNGSVAASEQPVVKPTKVAGIERVKSLHLGDQISCAVTQDDRLYCWGRNAQHEISDSMTKQITRPTRVDGAGRVELVAVGNYHLCWVSNGRAQCRGTLEPLDRDVAALANVTSISAGYEHSCAVHDGGKVSCWGGAYAGVLGTGDICPNKKTDGGACVSKLRPPALVPGIDGSAVQIAGNTYFTCVRASNGAVTCFGNNQSGAFSETLPKEMWQTAYVLPGVVADQVYVGGGHVCTTRAGVATCRGNDGAGAVRGAR